VAAVRPMRVDRRCAGTRLGDRAVRGVGIVALAVAIAAVVGCGLPKVTPPPTSTLPPQATAFPSASPPPSGSIASAAPSTPGLSPSASTTLDAILACGDTGIEFASSALSGPPMLVGPNEAVDALRGFFSDGGYPGMPASGWRTVAARGASLTFLAEGANAWWFVTVAADATGGWQAWEYGECHLAVHLPDALAYAKWRLDPKHPRNPDTATVTVLATEQSCANGRPPGSRLLAPVVVETDTTVTITLVVRRLGNADCPGNPEVSVVVPLRVALGMRTLLDGSTAPPAPR
jgi:hypothetical protein